MATAENTPERDDDSESDITPEELSLLDDSINNIDEGDDDANLKRSALDNTDEDGVLLNEGSMADDISGEDLDVPGAEADDHLEEIGEGDEENNAYSDADTD